jgi:hypothetical protein
VISGSRVKGIDRLVQRLIPLFLFMFQSKFKRYNYFITSFENGTKCIMNQIILFDDPNYDSIEMDRIRLWFKNQVNLGLESKIVCTNIYMRDYLRGLDITFDIAVIPQGHSNFRDNCYSNFGQAKPNKKLRLIYCSPYIDSRGDKNEGSTTWDATFLIERIWSQIYDLNHFELHLIGRVGNNARRMIQHKNLYIHGLKSIEDSGSIMENCDVGLYTRDFDHGRQAQKISEYIGAGLAIVTFKGVDSELVGKEGVGIEAHNQTEFLDALSFLYLNPKALENFKQKSQALKQKYSWKTLSAQLDSFI